MRNHRKVLAGAAAAALALLAAPAVTANDKGAYDLRSYPARSVEYPARDFLAAPGSPIHFGGGTAADTALAQDVAIALLADRRLDAATITVAANNGDVMISGSAETTEQGDIAQRAAQKVAGVTRVSGTLSTTSG